MNSLDKYLEIANEEKLKRGLDNFVPLYPMLRVDGETLYVVVMLTHESDNVWSGESRIKPAYWILIDITTEEVLEFNKTEEKDFVLGDIIPKNVENKQKEMSMYAVKKNLQYKDYLLADIKNEELPIQKRLSEILGDEIEIDGEKVNIKEYLLSNFEETLKSKIKDLVDVLIQSKYGSLTFYYDHLFKSIVLEYKSKKVIEEDNIRLCAEIMNNYYDGVIGIDNIFNA